MKRRVILIAVFVLLLVSGCLSPSIGGDYFQGSDAAAAAVGVAGSVAETGIAISAQNVALFAFLAFLVLIFFVSQRGK